MKRRQEDLERRAAADFRDRIDVAARLLDDAVDRGEAEARALAFDLGGVEGLEDLLHDLRRDACAIVDHFDQHIVALGHVREAVLAGRRGIRPRGADGEVAPAILLDHGVARVGAEVGDRGFELVLVDLHARQVAAVHDVQLDALVDDVAQQHVVVRQRIRHVEHFLAEHLLARDRPAACAPAPRRARHASLIDLSSKKVGSPGGWRTCSLLTLRMMPRQQVVEVVRDAAGELADGLHLLAHAWRAVRAAFFSVVSMT